MTSVQVATASGRVGGGENGGISSFKGVPYAAPPIGKLRFRPPAPPERWDGVRDATSYGDVVPQIEYSKVLRQLLGPHDPQGEDCLNLNVWTPDPTAGARLPVMVWIHPGGFTIGAGSPSLNDGTTFARSGVVLVSINYRVGIPGFLHLAPFFDGADGSGNFGMLDQIAALEWVQQNIAAFGGDPDNVTVFGQSGGAMSIATLLGIPIARGLFRRAITQSGAARNFLSAPTAERIGRHVLDLVGVTPGDWDGLQSLSTAQILNAHEQLVQEVNETHDPERFGEAAASGMIATHPVAGTDTLPVPAEQAVAAGSSAGIDLLFGTVDNELRLAFLDQGAVGMGEDSIVPMIDPMLAPAGRSAADTLDVYRRNRADADGLTLADAVLSDVMFRIPAVRLAEAHLAHGPNAWSYRFTWQSPQFDEQLLAGHSVDIPFVFHTLDDTLSRQLVGDDAPIALADAMHGAWVEFARTGVPGHASLPSWPRYTTSDRSTMIFGDRKAVVSDPGGAERDLWSGVL